MTSLLDRLPLLKLAAVVVLVVIGVRSGTGAIVESIRPVGINVRSTTTRIASAEGSAARAGLLGPVDPVLRPRLDVPDGSAIFSERNLAPGQIVSRTVTVTAPSVPANIELRTRDISSETSGFGTGELAAGLHLKVTDERAIVWYDGPFLAFETVTFCGQGASVLDSSCPPWTAGEQHRITLSVGLPIRANMNQFQGTETVFDLIWIAHAVTDAI